MKNDICINKKKMIFSSFYRLVVLEDLFTFAEKFIYIYNYATIVYCLIIIS